MKKLFGLLALVTLVTTASMADDFTFLKLNSHWRDLHSGKDNRTHTTGQEWRNEFIGNLALDDEWQGLSLKFDFLKKDFYTRSGDHKGQGWDNDIYLSKDFSHGAFEGDFKLGWKYEGYENKGHGNEFYLGPTVGFKLFGQEGTFSAQFVYYDDVSSGKHTLTPTQIEDKTYSRHYKDEGTSGIGGNFDFNFNGKIYEGKLGKIGYNLDIKNHLRDATDVKNTNSDGKNTVYMDYDGVIAYTTPRFWGFAAGVIFENEYEMQTATGWYNNGLYVTPNVSFQHDFNTSIGTLTFRPYVAWDAIDRQFSEDGQSDIKSAGYGDTKLKAGFDLVLLRGE